MIETFNVTDGNLLDGTVVPEIYREIFKKEHAAEISIVNSFLTEKIDHLPDREWKVIFDLANLLINNRAAVQDMFGPLWTHLGMAMQKSCDDFKVSSPGNSVWPSSIACLAIFVYKSKPALSQLLNNPAIDISGKPTLVGLRDKIVYDEENPAWLIELRTRARLENMLTASKDAELESLLNSKKLYDELKDEYDNLIFVLKRFKDQLEKKELKQISKSIDIAEKSGFYGKQRPHPCNCSFKAFGADACICGGIQDEPEKDEQLDLETLRAIDRKYLALLDQYESADRVLTNFRLRMKDVKSISDLRGDDEDISKLYD